MGGIEKPSVTLPLVFTAILVAGCGPVFLAVRAAKRGAPRARVVVLALAFAVQASYLGLQICALRRRPRQVLAERQRLRLDLLHPARHASRPRRSRAPARQLAALEAGPRDHQLPADRPAGHRDLLVFRLDRGGRGRPHPALPVAMKVPQAILDRVPPTSPASLSLWYAVLGAPAAWVVQMGFGYWLSEAKCSPAGGPWGSRSAIWGVAVGGVALAVAAGRRGRRGLDLPDLRRSPRTPARRANRLPRGRRDGRFDPVPGPDRDEHSRDPRPSPSATSHDRARQSHPRRGAGDRVGGCGAGAGPAAERGRPPAGGSRPAADAARSRPLRRQLRELSRPPGGRRGRGEQPRGRRHQRTGPVAASASANWRPTSTCAPADAAAEAGRPAPTLPGRSSTTREIRDQAPTSARSAAGPAIPEPHPDRHAHRGDVAVHRPLRRLPPGRRRGRLRHGRGAAAARRGRRGEVAEAVRIGPYLMPRFSEAALRPPTSTRSSPTSSATRTPKTAAASARPSRAGAGGLRRLARRRRRAGRCLRRDRPGAEGVRARPQGWLLAALLLRGSAAAGRRRGAGCRSGSCRRGRAGPRSELLVVALLFCGALLALGFVLVYALDGSDQTQLLGATLGSRWAVAAALILTGKRLVVPTEHSRSRTRRRAPRGPAGGRPDPRGGHGPDHPAAPVRLGLAASGGSLGRHCSRRWPRSAGVRHGVLLRHALAQGPPAGRRGRPAAAGRDIEQDALYTAFPEGVYREELAAPVRGRAPGGEELELPSRPLGLRRRTASSPTRRSAPTPAARSRCTARRCSRRSTRARRWSAPATTRPSTRRRRQRALRPGRTALPQLPLRSTRPACCGPRATFSGPVGAVASGACGRGGRAHDPPPRPLARPAHAAPRRCAQALRYMFPDHWSFLLGEVALYCFIVLVRPGLPDASSSSEHPRRRVPRGLPAAAGPAR